MDDRQQPFTQKTDLLDAWLAALRLGDPISDRALALVPLYADGRSRTVPYRTLAAAIALGEVIVTESAQATVSTLQLINKGELPVLILDGEEVVGGRQNRVVNTTLLVPACSSFDLPMSCVEHGRWHELQPVFDAGETAYPRLRSQKHEQVAASYAARGAPVADQAAVWDEVADRHRRIGSRSDTGAMRDAYAERQEDLTRAQQQLRSPDDGPVGVLALVSGRAACADIFDQTDTLAVYWTRLVRSYALEALGAEPATPSLDSALRLLQRPFMAQRTAFPSPGLGQDVRISGNGVVGAALVCEGVAIHTALFRHRRSDTNDPSTRRPSQRTRRFAQ
ncbi:MAG: hypothetical protein IT340_22410 [Chloroflexi bacterium]|nr:hypothetical protein [Chloroflexota bacterium]